MDSIWKRSPIPGGDDSTRTVIEALSAIAVLETVFVILYLTSRRINHTIKNWDVLFLLIGFVFSITHVISIIVGIVPGGHDRHLAKINPQSLRRMLKFAAYGDYVYVLAITFPKLSILFLYGRIFTTRPYRLCIYAVEAMVVLHCLAGLICASINCIPFAYFWDKSIPGGHCIDLAAVYAYINIPGLVTDLCILILPLWGIRNLQMNNLHKLGLGFTFLAGCLGMVTAILRFAFLCHIKFRLIEEATQIASWTVIEQAVYVIAVTLVSLRPLLRYFCTEVRVGALFYKYLSTYCKVLVTRATSKDQTSRQHSEQQHIKVRTTVEQKTTPRSITVSVMADPSSEDLKDPDHRVADMV